MRYVRGGNTLTLATTAGERAARMPATVKLRAAVKISPLIVFLCLFALSLLSLIAAYGLSLDQKSGAREFLGACVFFAILCAVVGTDGRVTLQALARAIRVMRHG